MVKQDWKFKFIGEFVFVEELLWKVYYCIIKEKIKNYYYEFMVDFFYIQRVKLDKQVRQGCQRFES